MVERRLDSLRRQVAGALEVVAVRRPVDVLLLLELLLPAPERRPGVLDVAGPLEDQVGGHDPAGADERRRAGDGKALAHRPGAPSGEQGPPKGAQSGHGEAQHGTKGSVTDKDTAA